MRIPVRFRDIDSQGHANHSAILDMIAEARIALLDECVRKSGLPLDYVLVKITAEFFREIKHPDWVEVRPRIKKIGTKSVTSEYQLFVNDEIAAKAECVNVFFDRGTKQTKPIPSVLKRIIGAA